MKVYDCSSTDISSISFGDDWPHIHGDMVKNELYTVTFLNLTRHLVADPDISKLLKVEGAPHHMNIL